MPSDDLARLARDHNDLIDDIVAVYERALQEIVSVAQAKVVAALRGLALAEGGQVARTAGNMRLLRSLDSVFERAMRAAGVETLNEETVRAFTRQYAFFDRTLDLLDLPPMIWRRVDQDALAAQLTASADNLDGVVKQVAETAKRKALFQVGGLRMTELAALLGEEYGKTATQAAALADTSMAMFYAQVADRGYRLIEADHGALRFKYYGPDDKITRDFCQRLVGKTYTRVEIDKMDNGQIPGVFVSRGGYRCRHQWIVALDQTELPQPRDRRTGEQAFDDLLRASLQLADTREYWAKQEAEARQLRQLGRAIKAMRRRKEIDRTINARLFDVLSASVPAEPETDYDPAAPRSVMATWREGVRAFSRLVGARADIDGRRIRFKLYEGRAGYHIVPSGLIRTGSSVDTGTVVHELAHWLEQNNPAILRLTTDFLARRAKGKRPKSLRKLTGQPYRSDERAVDGGFLTPYIGKLYAKGKDGRPIATEVLTMGLQLLYDDPTRLLEDRDFFEVIWEALRGQKVLLAGSGGSGKMKP